MSIVLQTPATDDEVEIPVKELMIAGLAAAQCALLLKQMARHGQLPPVPSQIPLDQFRAIGVYIRLSGHISAVFREATAR